MVCLEKHGYLSYIELDVVWNKTSFPTCLDSLSLLKLLHAKEGKNCHLVIAQFPLTTLQALTLGSKAIVKNTDKGQDFLLEHKQLLAHLNHTHLYQTIAMHPYCSK